MDLHRKQPIVFNQCCTPDVSVAAAVVASCAIPVAMPAGRVVMPLTDPEGNTTTSVHRLVDGGAWANYPAFVYSDASFRRYHGLDVLPDDVVTLGFVIEGDEAPRFDDGVVSPRPPRPPEPDAVRTPGTSMSPYDRGSARHAGFAGALLTWTGLRWVAAIAMPAAISFFLLLWLADQRDDGFDAFDALTPELQYPAILLAGTAVLLTAYAAATFAAIQARFAYEAIDVGIPSLNAALAVGTGVPDWVGEHPDDRVVRLWSPAGVSTTRFRIGTRILQIAVCTAEVVAAQQLDKMFPEQPRASLDDVPRTSVDPVVYQPTHLSRPVKVLIWAAAVVGVAALGTRTGNPGAFFAILVLGPAIGGLFGWALVDEGSVLPRPSRLASPDAESVDVSDHLAGEPYHVSAVGLGVRAAALAGAVALGMLAITQRGRLSIAWFALYYVLFAAAGVWALKAFVYRRRVNQGLLGEAPPRRALLHAVVGAALLAGGVVWMGAVIDESTTDAAVAGDISDLALPTLATLIAAVGLGALVSVAFRLGATLNFNRYQAALDRR